MKPRRTSIVRRLAYAFTLVGSIVLCAMAAGVYLSTGWLLQSRHDAELDRVSRVVRHLVEENGRDDSLELLRHKLDDLLVGESNLVVSIVRLSDRQSLYASRTGPAEARDRLERRLRIETPTEGLGSVEALVAFDTSADRRLLKPLGLTAAVAALMGAAVLGLLGARIAQRGLQPVGDLARALERWTPEQPRPQAIEAERSVELAPLIERFQAMLSEIRVAHEQLQSFNEDVAHELRTPLAALIGEAEWAISRDRPNPELVATLEHQLDELRKLSQIVTDMLFLARAEPSALSRRATVASVAGVAGAVIDYFDAMLHERGLTARIEGDACGAFDVELLKRALSNLMANAVRYADPGSEILVSVRTGSVPGWIAIAAHNRGPVVAAEHLPRLFDRFFRASASREHSARHHGLGLAIVAAIARMHGGSTFASSADGVTTVGLTIDTGRAQGSGGPCADIAA